MKLRKYKTTDSDIISGWIVDERSLYQWSADRINKFPLSGEDINNCYLPMMHTGRFIPLTFIDQSDNIIGHLTIRYPIQSDRVVRFGFVIVAPVLRGKGYGKAMLLAAVEYAKITLNAEIITLGVFANNDSAKYCYQSVGFKSVGKNEIYQMPLGEWECIEMSLSL